MIMMLSSNMQLILALLAAFVPMTYGGISWGEALGAGWADAEEMMRKNVATSVRNLQKFCTPDVLNLCPGGKDVIDKKKSDVSEDIAVTAWTSSSFQRHTYNKFAQVPFGFGTAVDNCLRNEFYHYQTIEHSKRLTPKCFDWMTKTEEHFNLYHEREKGDDEREWLVIFSTLFAMAMSAAVGYLIGMYQKEHEDILAFSHERRRESKKIFTIIALAISIPFCIVLYTCPKLLVLMTISLLMGRAAQWYVQKKEEISYSALSGDSGLVFAAIPVQMD